MELSESAVRAGKLGDYISRHGLPPAVLPGTTLDHFNAAELAHALECETTRASLEGLTKVRVTLDLPDAVALAKFLRLGG